MCDFLVKVIICRADGVASVGEGADDAQLVLQGLVTVKLEILISVGRFPIYTKTQCSIIIHFDMSVQNWYLLVFHFLYRELDGRVYSIIEMCIIIISKYVILNICIYQ